MASDEAVRAALRTSSVVVKNIGRAGQMVLSASVSGKVATVWGRLPLLNLNARFRKDSNGIHAWFRGGEGCFDAVYEWTPPDDMAINLVAVCEQSEDGSWFVQGSTQPLCYLVARSSKKPGFFRLPTSNVYADARICMGSAVNPAPTLSQVWHNACNQFSAGRFNSDLYNHSGGDEYETLMFRWDFSERQLQVRKDWESMCRAVNSTIYSCIE